MDKAASQSQRTRSVLLPRCVEENAYSFVSAYAVVGTEMALL